MRENILSFSMTMAYNSRLDALGHTKFSTIKLIFSSLTTNDDYFSITTKTAFPIRVAWEGGSVFSLRSVLSFANKKFHIWIDMVRYFPPPSAVLCQILRTKVPMRGAWV